MKPESTSELDEIKRIGDLLDRVEWDFSSCPEDRLGFCLAYEYAREVPEIIERFEQAQKHDRSQFDEHGQWHHIFYSYTERNEKEPGDVLDAPVGFPDQPYLKTTHHVHPGSYYPFLVGHRPLHPVVVNPDGTYEVGGRHVPGPVFHFQIDLRFADKPIVEAFAEWLEKTHGDREAIEKRGRSEPTCSCRRSSWPSSPRKSRKRLTSWS